MFVFLLAYIIQGVILGFAAQKIVENKGYYENWFWWGFFFGFIALIVALSKPENHVYSYTSDNSSSDSYANYKTKQERQKSFEQSLLDSGGWRCSCGKVNSPHSLSCSCGKSKNEPVILVETSVDTSKETIATSLDEYKKLELIKEYKSLLDADALTQEEFEKKKKQLLEM